MTETWQATMNRLDLPSLLDDDDLSLSKITLIGRLKRAEAEGDEQGRTLCQILACATALYLHPDSRDQVFGATSDVELNRLFEDGRLTAQATEVLTIVGQYANHSALQARANDLLWVFNRDHVAGRRAVEHYLAVADDVRDQEGLNRLDALVRVANLSLSLGKKATERQTVTDALERHARAVHRDFPWTTARLMELLLVRGAGDPAVYARLSEQLAREAEGAEDWRMAHRYWSLAADWYERQGDTESRQASRLRAAEMRVSMAGSVPGSQKNRNRLGAALLIEQAIQEFRSIPGTHERVAELRAQLDALQKQGVDEFKTLTIPIGESQVSNIRHWAQNCVAGKDPTRALIRIGQTVLFDSQSSLRVQAQQELATPTLSTLMTTRYVDRLGRTKASTATSDEGRVLELMHRRQQLIHEVCTVIFLHEARHSLLDEHAVHRDHLAPLLDGNPVVPAEHSESILLGLEAGLRGDFISAAALLTPKFETLLRRILELYGKATTSLSPRGVQDSIELNRLLEEEEFLEPLTRHLGQDFIFELQGLLIRRHGYNFRNEWAHGLTSDGEAHYVGQLVWYAALRIVCHIPTQAGDSG